MSTQSNHTTTSTTDAEITLWTLQPTKKAWHHVNYPGRNFWKPEWNIKKLQPHSKPMMYTMQIFMAQTPSLHSSLEDNTTINLAQILPKLWKDVTAHSLMANPRQDNLESFYNLFAECLSSYDIHILTREDLQPGINTRKPSETNLSPNTKKKITRAIYQKLLSTILEECTELREVLDIYRQEQDGYTVLYNMMQKMQLPKGPSPTMGTHMASIHNHILVSCRTPIFYWKSTQKWLHLHTIQNCC